MPPMHHYARETGALLTDQYIKGTELEDKLIGQKNWFLMVIILVSLTMQRECAEYITASHYSKKLESMRYHHYHEDFLEVAKTLTKNKADGTMQYGFGAVISTHAFAYDEMKTFICYPIGATYTQLNKPPFEPDNIIVGNEAWNYAFKWWQDMIFTHKVVALLHTTKPVNGFILEWCGSDEY